MKEEKKEERQNSKLFKNLVTLVTIFGLYPKDNRKAIKILKQQDALFRIVF